MPTSNLRSAARKSRNFKASPTPISAGASMKYLSNQFTLHCRTDRPTVSGHSAMSRSSPCYEVEPRRSPGGDNREQFRMQAGIGVHRSHHVPCPPDTEDANAYQWREAVFVGLCPVGSIFCSAKVRRRHPTSPISGYVRQRLAWRPVLHASPRPLVGVDQTVQVDGLRLPSSTFPPSTSTLSPGIELTVHGHGGRRGQTPTHGANWLVRRVCTVVS